MSPPFALPYINVRAAAFVTGSTTPPLPLIIELETDNHHVYSIRSFRVLEKQNAQYKLFANAELALASTGLSVYGRKCTPIALTSAIHTPLSTPETGDCKNEKEDAAA